MPDRSGPTEHHQRGGSGHRARGRTAGVLVVAGGLALGLTGCTGSTGSAADAAAPSPTGLAAAVSAGQSDCGVGWSGGTAGTWRIDATNTSTGGMDVVVADAATDMTRAREYLELEAIGPGAGAGGEVTLGPGSYRVVCVQADEEPVLGPVVRVTGTLPAGTTATPGIVPVTQADLVPAAKVYETWVAAHLATLSRQVRALDDDVARGDLEGARRDWLTAHTTYGTLGGAYDAFGDLGDAIDGFPATGSTALTDHDLTGFRRIEALLWAGRPASAVRPVTRALVTDVATLRSDFPAAQVDPMDLGIRAHEILEDAVQVQLSGAADGPSGTALAEIEAGVVGTRQPLGALRPLLKERGVDLTDVDAALATLERTLRGYDHDGRWTPRTDLTTAQRERLDAEVDTCVEHLATVAALADPRRAL
ncbi:imelysin family protein [Luteimicrobium sp. NPDC057192]|uniref:imelysin family protein n=1 Tax=Luteimicrobium sp. NPDC057192 TaxID=3346042 RepID=UPI0036374242